MFLKSGAHFLMTILTQTRACLKENSSLHISMVKAGLQFMKNLFTKTFLFTQPNFRMTFFVTAQTAFLHCTFRFITARFVHHCTLKQALTQTLTVKGHPFMTTTRKLGFFTPFPLSTCAHMSLTPPHCGRPKAVDMKYT